ncbi:hypothetical protein RM844_11050 [Streptomyces sp. DSM 44915]|uniref:Uncharacterized protein n=1 Tax=Streptomyces chisholmiae TaxID=3075540 RepID=A0ABU2JRH1_9ACTN|nr:hypothetical protein [Streptomyces sp. DSM 44915]MDT0266828.1 hypothetical protein [Streptomyces sp. DSM 44915]
MLDTAYLRALTEAELVAPGGYFSGSTVWRERGLACVELLVDAYLRRLAEFSDPERVEHPFLLPRGPYREVFPDYRNVYSTRPARDHRPSWVLRPDNLDASVRALTAAGHDGPLVAVGGLLRHFRGPVQPLFRERYIWPAVQVTHLVPAGEALATLDRHQRALEDFLADLALPVVSVTTDAHPGYGVPCHLTVTCLPDGRPTVLSTSYLMSEERARALGVLDAVLDIGFTGKLLALVAGHHRDPRHLLLPSRLAPVQVGVTHQGDGQAPPEVADWLRRLAAQGVRVASTGAAPLRGHRRRAERRWLRSGAPLVVTHGRTTTLTRRLPLRRDPVDALPEDAALRAELAASDRRLRAHTDRRFRRALWDSDLLRTVCDTCAARHRLPVLGHLTPPRTGPCSTCSGTGAVVLVSEAGRFY